MPSHRRDFIKFTVAGSIAAGCPVDRSLIAAPSPAAAVDGEQNEVCHQLRDGRQFSRPPVSRHYDVIIVGGGVSGLMSTHFYRQHDFLLLEKEPHWGGNAYLEQHQGQAFATGTAFTDRAEAAVMELADIIGLKLLPVDNWDGSIIQGEFIPDTWGQGLDHLPYPARVRDSFKKFRKDMLAINLSARERELENTPFSKFCEGYAPEIKQWWDAYGPSNWGGATENTAAHLVIGELQSVAGPDRKDERLTLPGGLGAITRRLSERLLPHYADRMLLGATAVAVESQKQEVHVTFVRGDEIRTVAAKVVIMATPKFITSRIVAGLPAEQKEAMSHIHYIPYPVINLIFDKPVFNRGYDTWCPGNTFTDFIVADWVMRKQPGYQQKFNILTFYTPMAAKDRPRLLTEEGCRDIAAAVLRDFQKLFPGSDVDPVEVHLYRRGHPMFVSAPGNVSRVIPAARQPMERIFFANTDSQGPISTTAGAIEAARRAFGEAAPRLAGKGSA
jgi:monoamine oxidase